MTFYPKRQYFITVIVLYISTTCIRFVSVITLYMQCMLSLAGYIAVIACRCGLINTKNRAEKKRELKSRDSY
jgi:hypothetical protein